MSFRIKFILPSVLILSAIFLRFYRFREFVTFLGDQGRDAIIIKRILTFEHFPAIGAPSSLGQIFLGPFYYYFISPFLLLFNYSPIGLAFGVGLINLIGIYFSYFIIKKETNFLTALLFLIFISFSTVNIQYSRFSWNPNLLPVFSFFTIYFFYKTLTSKNKLFAVLFGSFLSFSIQLHHLAFLLVVPIIVVYVSRIVVRIWSRFAPQNDVKNIIISCSSFLFFSLPLIIFDLRHNFLNTRNLFKFFIQGGPADHKQFLVKFLETNNLFYSHIFQINFNQYSALALTFLILFFSFKKLKVKKNLFLLINLLIFILYLLMFSLFNTSRIAHYYNLIYFSFFLILSWMIINVSKDRFIKLCLILFIAGSYLILNIKSLSYLFFTRGNNQIKSAERIADSILMQNPQTPYQTVALPYVETDGHIRYFLEIKGKAPLPSDTLANPKELYVLCFIKECQVLGNAQWQIAAFRNAKIDRMSSIEGVKIYKIIHQL